MTKTEWKAVATELEDVARRLHDAQAKLITTCRLDDLDAAITHRYILRAQAAAVVAIATIQ